VSHLAAWMSVMHFSAAVDGQGEGVGGGLDGVANMRLDLLKHLDDRSPAARVAATANQVPTPPRHPPSSDLQVGELHYRSAVMTAELTLASPHPFLTE